jgi:hypothetical protein
MRSTDLGPVHPPEPIDVEFVRVSGPFRPGDPHPQRRGWFFTGLHDESGDLLWYQPPPAWRRWCRLAGEGMFIAMFLLTGIGATLVGIFGYPAALPDGLGMGAIGLVCAVVLIPRWKEPFNLHRGGRSSRRRSAARAQPPRLLQRRAA